MGMISGWRVIPQHRWNKGSERTPFHNQKAAEETRIFQKMGIGTGRGHSLCPPGQLVSQLSCDHQGPGHQ